MSRHLLFALMMVVMHGVASAALVRPQTPVPPFPYREVELAYDSPADPGVHLTGTLTMPAGSGPHPAVLLITGSGQQDRDETIFDHKPFLVLADHLARQGIASLRVDDRGKGGSHGEVANATTQDFARDASVSLAQLRAAPGIDPDRVGLVGHSEGGLIAAMLAAEPGNHVAFIVMLAGPGLSGAKILSAQVEDSARMAGVSGPALETIVELQESLIAQVLASHENSADLAERLASSLMKHAPAMSVDMARQRVARLATPWFRYFLATDPAEFLSRVQCPVLALNGSLDRQVRATDNLTAIGRALTAAGNTEGTLMTLAGLNHLFQTATTGAPSEYAQIDETIAPTALAQISDWIQHRFPARH